MLNGHSSNHGEDMFPATKHEVVLVVTPTWPRPGTGGGGELTAQEGKGNRVLLTA